MGENAADRNGVILEVSAGVGGQEAMLFCAELFNMYCNYGLAKGWDVSVVSKDEVELGMFTKSILLCVIIGMFIVAVNACILCVINKKNPK